MTRRGWFIAALWALVAVVAAPVLWIEVIRPQVVPAATSTIGRGDYALTTTDGGTFTEASLKGPTAVFFGFTHCPEVCPTTLGDIAGWQQALEEEGRAPLDVYFVTVDPERDTPEVLGEYVSWAPGVVGVTGTPDEMEKAQRAFRVFAQRVPLDGGGYTMDHSAFVLLFDEDGTLFEPIGYGEGFERAMEKLRRLAS